MKAYADIADFDEGTRIETIGRYVMSHPTEKVAFITDAEPGKADRYIERLKTRFPEIIVFVILMAGYSDEVLHRKSHGGTEQIVCGVAHVAAASPKTSAADCSENVHRIPYWIYRHCRLGAAR